MSIRVSTDSCYEHFSTFPLSSHKLICLSSLKFPYYYSNAIGYVPHSSELLKHSIYLGKKITDSPVISCKPLT